MASKVFLDVNILLDLTLKRDSYSVASQIISKAIAGEINSYISPSIAHIAGYWLTKAYGATKAKEILLTLLADVQVIEMDHAVTLHALHSKMTDIEDALQYYTALHHKMDVFISRDKQLKKFAISSLPVLTPEDFLKLYQ